MTLTRRALLVVFPVVLVSNLLVALAVYEVQRKTIEDSEAARFAMRMKGLGASFAADLEFTRNLVFSMLSGDAVRAFVREPNAEFRATGLGVKVQNGIRFFSQERDRFISFAIIAPDLTISYYFENSDDPFAEIRPQQIDVGKRLLKRSASSSNDFVQTPDGGLIIHSEVIDRRTFQAPLATQKEFAFVVQSAIRPAAFEQMSQAIEAEYGGRVSMTSGRDIPAGNLSYAERLTPELTLSSELPPAYLAARLDRLIVILVAGSVVLSLLSVGLLVFLIRRTVTGPIATLDREVKEVIEGHREEMSTTLQTGEVGRLSSNIKTLHDASLRALRKVQQMSWTDSLTGVSNRPHLHLVGREWMEKACRERTSLALLFIDLDNFKHVNDTFGHAAGDAVLKAFADRVSELLRRLGETGGETRLARLAGDEFALLLLAEERSAVGMARAMIGLFASGLEVDGRIYPVSASIGVALAPEHARDFDDLISCADTAMYHAKAAGKNGCALFSPSLRVLARAS